MKPMNSAMYKTGLIVCFLAGLFLGMKPATSQAQIVDPFKQYTNPDEIVAFNKSTTYNEAIEIINTFAQEYQNKFIVDKSAYSGTIGVNLPAMHWKDALEYIMRFNNLELTEHEEFYEITVPQPKQTTARRAADARTGGAAGGTDAKVSSATTETQEVRINATFFEGNKRALQEIGIDWSTLTSDVPANLGDFVGTDGKETVPSTDFNDQFVSVNSYNAASVSQNAFNALVNMGELGPGIRVQALFSAFEADNLGKVLATPSIKVVDGEEGEIQVGQDFSIKQQDIAGNVIDNFVSTGTILTVTPQIINHEDTSFVYLDLEVERSTVQPDVISTIINTQKAQTSAILLDGEATYVAGLYRTEETSVRRGVPILKDLPGWFFGLKYLFGYNSKDYSENELIIIVRAELVKPVSERIAERLSTKRDVLNATRDNMRTDLDQAFDNKWYVPEKAEAPKPIPVEEQVEETAEVPAEVKEVQIDTAEVIEPSPETEPELTKEEEEIAKNLTMPVTKPELMVVVPKAFNLEEYLAYQQNKEEEKAEATDLKYFVIGGSFLVPSNAENFKKTLIEQGYNPQILFHPQSGFNYVAYEGYANFKEAVRRTLQVREDLNHEAWLFTLRNGK